MTTYAGHSSHVKLAGAATAVTGGATTALSAGTYSARRQITNAAQRVLDPASAIVVKDGVATVAATNYVVDYLFGIINLLVVPAGTITVDFSYLPLLAVASARKSSIAASRTELDSSVYGNQDKALMVGLKAAEVELEQLDLLEDDMDPGAGTTTWAALQDAGTPKLLELQKGGRLWRGWGLFPNLAEQSSPDALVTATVKFKTTVLRPANRPEVVSCGFGAP